MLVQGESLTVPGPPLGVSLSGERLLAHDATGRGGSKGRERLLVLEGQKAQKWIPRMYILALLTSRVFTKALVF